MPITTPEQARHAARDMSAAGPIAEFADGGTPPCFARLRLALAGMRRESLATAAELDMADGPDDPLMERGKEEVAEISSAIGALLAWVEEQLCQVEFCECRADRLLRYFLEEAQVPGQTGYSPSWGATAASSPGVSTVRRTNGPRTSSSSTRITSIMLSRPTAGGGRAWSRPPESRRCTSRRATR